LFGVGLKITECLQHPEIFNGRGERIYIFQVIEVAWSMEVWECETSSRRRQGGLEAYPVLGDFLVFVTKIMLSSILAKILPKILETCLLLLIKHLSSILQKLFCIVLSK